MYDSKRSGRFEKYSLRLGYADPPPSQREANQHATELVTVARSHNSLCELERPKRCVCTVSLVCDSAEAGNCEPKIRT